MPDIPSNTPHSPVIPVEGPNATNAYAYSIVCGECEYDPIVACFAHAPIPPHDHLRKYRNLFPSKKSNTGVEPTEGDKNKASSEHTWGKIPGGKIQ